MSENLMQLPAQNQELPAKCHAKTRKGLLCPNFARKNGRCRLHGGLSTGPRTPQGLARAQKASWKHGFHSRQFKEEQRATREAMKLLLDPQELAGMLPEELQAHFEALSSL